MASGCTHLLGEVARATLIVGGGLRGHSPLMGVAPATTLIWYGCSNGHQYLYLFLFYFYLYIYLFLLMYK